MTKYSCIAYNNSVISHTGVNNKWLAIMSKDIYHNFRYDNGNNNSSNFVISKFLTLLTPFYNF